MRVDASSVDSTECRHGNAVCGVAGGHCSSPALFLELVEQTFFESHTGPGGDPFDLLSRGSARARTRFSHRDGVCKLHLPDWKNAFVRVFHTATEYVSFICLIGSLFVI